MIYPGFIESKELSEADKNLDKLLQKRTELDKQILLAQKEINTVVKKLENKGEIKMTDKKLNNPRVYEEVEIMPGTNIADAFKLMKEEAERDGTLKYINFNGHIFQSDSTKF